MDIKTILERGVVEVIEKEPLSYKRKMVENIRLFYSYNIDLHRYSNRI